MKRYTPWKGSVGVEMTFCGSKGKTTKGKSEFRKRKRQGRRSLRERMSIVVGGRVEEVQRRVYGRIVFLEKTGK